MPDPLTIATGLIAVVTATIQASKALYQAVQSFKSHQSTVERLTRELLALSLVLESLAQHVAADETPFRPLEYPMQRCTEACEGFKQLLDKSTRHYDGLRTSFRDWSKLRFMSNDVDDFTDVLASYKQTICIALADANLRTSKVTIGVLNEYKDMIHDTKHDLERHLAQISQKLESLAQRDRKRNPDADASVQRMENERSSTERCIEYCNGLLGQINAASFQVVGEAEPLPGQSTEAPSISPQNMAYPDAFTLALFKGLSTRISEALDHLTDHRQAELQRSSAKDPQSADEANLDRERLQGEASSIQQRLAFFEGASDRASQAKVHALEDISVGDNGSQVCISTLGDLFNIKTARAGDGSFQFFGSTSEAGLSEILRAQDQHRRAMAVDWGRDRDRDRDRDKDGNGDGNGDGDGNRQSTLAYTTSGTSGVSCL